MGKIKDSKNNFKKLKKSCAVCGKEINVKLFPDRHYRGGHYFGKIHDGKKNLEYEVWGKLGRKCETCQEFI